MTSLVAAGDDDVSTSCPVPVYHPSAHPCPTLASAANQSNVSARAQKRSHGISSREVGLSPPGGRQQCPDCAGGLRRITENHSSQIQGHGALPFASLLTHLPQMSNGQPYARISGIFHGGPTLSQRPCQAFPIFSPRARVSGVGQLTRSTPTLWGSILSIHRVNSKRNKAKKIPNPVLVKRKQKKRK